MTADATQLDTREHLAKYLNGSTERPDVDALLTAIAARMSAPAGPGVATGQMPGQAPGQAPGQTLGQALGAYAPDAQDAMGAMGAGAPGRPEADPSDLAALLGFDPGHGLDGVHPDDLLEMAMALEDDAPVPYRRDLGRRLTNEMLRQDPEALYAHFGARRAGQAVRGHGGNLVSPAALRDQVAIASYAERDPLFKTISSMITTQINALPAVFRSFVRDHLVSDPQLFNAAYHEMRRKIVRLTAKAGSRSGKDAPTLERSGAGRELSMDAAKKAKVMALTKKLKERRGSVKDFGEILELTGVIDRMNR